MIDIGYKNQNNKFIYEIEKKASWAQILPFPITDNTRFFYKKYGNICTFVPKLFLELKRF